MNFFYKHRNFVHKHFINSVLMVFRTLESTAVSALMKQTNGDIENIKKHMTADDTVDVTTCTNSANTDSHLVQHRHHL